MSIPKFVWIIRTWCSLDTFWEHVREHKEYDIAYVSPVLVLEEIQRIVEKEQSEWQDICTGTGTKCTDREFTIEIPLVDQVKSRPFFKFMTLASTASAKEEFMQSWYVERLKVIE